LATVRIILHGKATGDARVRKAVQALRRNGHLIEVRVTWEPGDAARLTAEAVAEARNEGLDCIVAGGGDGTINEVFAAAYAAGLPAGCALGVLPLGTANDFAHAAGVPVDDLTAALRIAASAPSRAIDLGLVDGRAFINLVSGGFGSRVTAETDPELKQRLGGLAYAITGISRFAELSANNGVFRAEGFSWEGHVYRARDRQWPAGRRRRAALPERADRRWPPGPDDPARPRPGGPSRRLFPAYARRRSGLAR